MRYVLGPLALGIALLQISSFASAEDRAPRTFDASLPRPFIVSLRGANAQEAWLSFEGRQSREHDEAILDLKTGCVVETLPRFDRIAQLDALFLAGRALGAPGAADPTKEAESRLGDTATQAEIARYVAAGKRFGRRSLGDWAFSGDGATVLTTVAETAFRSRDGGRRFQRLDQNQSRYPAVTTDGKWLFYERCADGARRNQSCPDASREVAVVAADDATPPRHIPIGSGLLRGLDTTGQKLVVVRYDVPNEVTVMHVDPAAGAMTRAFGIPARTLPQGKFFDIDPSPATGGFGVFEDNLKHPVSALTVASMTDGRIVQRVSATNVMGTNIDEEAGRLLYQTYYDDHAWARTAHGATRDLGMGDPVGWAPGGRALVFAAKYTGGRRADDPPATLRAVACKLVRITTL